MKPSAPALWTVSSNWALLDSVAARLHREAVGSAKRVAPEKTGRKDKMKSRFPECDKDTSVPG